MAGVLVVVPVLLSCLESRVDSVSERAELTEASGICVADGKLLLVGDDSDGRYFEYPLPHTDCPIIPLDPGRLREIPLKGAELAMDLESIDLLADGRIAVLSEQLRCLISKRSGGNDRYGVVAEYDKSVTELGNRGLEGLAVKAVDRQASLVAVVWEGGYPGYHYLPEEWRDEISRRALEPVVIVHRIDANSASGWVDKPLFKFKLTTPKDTNSMPLAQRYRAPDLVWYEHESDSGLVDGLIVLLESENAPEPNSGNEPRYLSKILQRYDMTGNPIGAPVEINELVKQVIPGNLDELKACCSKEMRAHLKNVLAKLDAGNWENVNWEGMSWYERGRSLIIVYDSYPADPPIAFIIPVPEEWR